MQFLGKIFFAITGASVGYVIGSILSAMASIFFLEKFGFDHRFIFISFVLGFATIFAVVFMKGFFNIIKRNNAGIIFISLIGWAIGFLIFGFFALICSDGKINEFIVLTVLGSVLTSYIFRKIYIKKILKKDKNNF